MLQHAYVRQRGTTWTTCCTELWETSTERTAAKVIRLLGCIIRVRNGGTGRFGNTVPSAAVVDGVRTAAHTFERIYSYYTIYKKVDMDQTAGACGHNTAYCLTLGTRRRQGATGIQYVEHTGLNPKLNLFTGVT